MVLDDTSIQRCDGVGRCFIHEFEDELRYVLEISVVVLPKWPDHEVVVDISEPTTCVVVGCIAIQNVVQRANDQVGSIATP